MEKARSYDGYNGEVVAEVVRIEKKDYYSSVTLKTKSVGEEKAKIRIQTNIYDDDLDFIEGDIVELNGTLSGNFPRGILDIGKMFNACEKIFLKMKVSSVQKTSLPSNPLRNAIYKFRASTENDISLLNNNNLISELLLGSGRVDAQTSKMFQSLGLSHALAVSGMHLSILVMTFYTVLRKYPLGKYLISAICISLTLFYMALTGFTFSILRAGIMMISYFLSISIRRPSDSTTTLFASAIFIMSFNPWAIFSIGFQLSFLSTLGIITFCPPVIKPIKESRFFSNPIIGRNIVLVTILSLLRKFLLSIIFAAINTLSATIATLPLTVIYFGSFTLFSIISNITILFVINLLLGVSIIYSVICLTHIAPLITAVGEICNAISYTVMSSANFLYRIFPSPLHFSPEESAVLAIIMSVAVVVSILLFKKPRHLVYITVILTLCTIASVYSVSLISRSTYYLTFSTTESCRDIIVENDGKTVLFSPHADTYSFDALSDILSQRNIYTLDMAIFATDGDLPIEKISKLSQMANIKKAVFVSIDGNISSKDKKLLKEALTDDCIVEFTKKQKLSFTDNLYFNCSKNRYYSLTLDNGTSQLLFLYCLNKSAIMPYSQLSKNDGVVIYSPRKNYPNISPEGYYFCENPTSFNKGKITDDTGNFDFGFVKLKKDKIRTKTY
jgi:ComEC/Rec2-related protein